MINRYSLRFSVARTIASVLEISTLFCFVLHTSVFLFRGFEKNKKIKITGCVARLFFVWFEPHVSLKISRERERERDFNTSDNLLLYRYRQVDNNGVKSVSK